MTDLLHSGVPCVHVGTPNGREALKLHLGAGYSKLAGWINCDLHDNPNIDKVFDLQQPWPFDDNAAATIYASHVLEHLRDPWAFFQEAWRVLQPNGSMTLRLPYGDHRAAWWDLSHVRPWFAESFCFLQPGYAAAVGNPQHTESWPFGVASIDLRVSGKFARWMRWKWLRTRLLYYGENVQNFVEELWVNLWALKSAEAVADYRRDHPYANAVGTRWVMYKHHLELRPNLRPQELPELVSLLDDAAVNGFHSWCGWG